MQQQLQEKISSVRYDPMFKRVVFYTKFKGLEIPFSYVYKNLGSNAYVPINLNRLTSMTGITWSDIIQGQGYIH